jgi:hypothetical protein
LPAHIMRRAIAAWLIVAAGCPTLVYANPAHEQISKMGNAERNAFFAKFLRQSGENCNVVRNFYQGSTNRGDAFWNVGCKGKDGFSIMIYNDAKGSTKILECRVMKAVGGTPCFKKF